MKKFLLFSFIGLLLSLQSNPSIASVNPFIDSLNPKQNTTNAFRGSDINVYFISDMNASTLNNNTIKVHASQTGMLNTSINYNTGMRKLTINPETDFKAGEEISIHLSNEILTSANLPITAFVYNFIAGTSNIQSIFTRQSAVSTGGGDASFIAPGDFNHDGDIDIAVTCKNTGNFLILENNGNGTFTQTQLINFRKANFLISLDFNNDGYLDLIVTRQSYDLLPNEAAIKYYKNNGSGIFTEAGLILNGAEVIGSEAISAMDYNGDGYLDVVCNTRVNTSSPGLQIYKNTGGFGFYVISRLTSNPINALFTTGDFDNDGDFDVAIRDFIFLNNGNGFFNSNVFNSGSVWALINSDFNKDGFSDIAGLLYDANECNIFKNNGNGSFSFLSSNFAYSGPIYHASGDFNGDGNLDIAVANRISNNILILKNTGTGNFTSSTVSNNTGGYENDIKAADFDTDGDLDIALANIAGSITIFFNDNDVYINNENGIPYKFELSQNFPNPFNPTTKINYELPAADYVSLKVFDINGKEMAVLVNKKQNAGSYSVEFNGSNFSSGVYFFRMESGEFRDIRKMILAK